MEIANWNYVKTFSFLVSQNLLQLAAITHCTSSEGIGGDSSKEARHHLDQASTLCSPDSPPFTYPEELHVAQQIHLVRKWASQQAS